MNMRLKNSRGLFFARTGEPQISFWANPKLSSLVQETNGREIPSHLLNWKPCADISRSNCPMLQDLLGDVIKLVGPKWRAYAANIYAGRTYSDVDMAEADKNLRGGMVAISIEFTNILIAYSSMYGTFINSMDFAKRLSTEASEAMWNGMRGEFDKNIAAYRRDGILALKGSLPMVYPSDQFRVATELLSEAAEAWSIAHELSHHLARDMSARKDKEVRATVDNLVNRSSVGPEIHKMPPSHREEVYADLLATLIMSGHFAPEKRTPMGISDAISGATLSLITIAHLRDEWVTSVSDTHPGCFDRIRILLTVISEIYGGLSVAPDDPEREHMVVRRFAALLMTYGHWAENVNLRGILSSGGGTRNSHLLHEVFARYAVEFDLLAEAYQEKI